MRAAGRRTGFAARLLLGQALVILAGGITLLVVALGLAPGMFRGHVEYAVGPITNELATHLDMAFSRAILVSLAVSIAVATLTALAVGWFVSRRAVRPLRELSEAAGAVASGDYTVRVRRSGYGAELDSLADAFEQMARSIARTEMSRAEVLRDLSHELRTPLTTVRGYHEAIADGVLPADRATFERIDAEISRIERLVDDVGRISSAEERGLDLHLSEIAAGDLLRIAASGEALAFEGKGVRLTLGPDASARTVVVDPDRMQEVLANLLRNALRHTPAGGLVELSARPTAEGVVITVRDSGDGIAAEHLPRVFERFYRVDDGRSRGVGGSGIGLAIARALTEAHGGHIRAESAGAGEGASFIVTLPASQGRRGVVS
ncbi:HAMP domain-containing protein [Demequina sp. TTPB684]|uniref:sensor histidine kinase n=1 Tax=unclassified Demequina TaxID=2620311 RepID=UPI001CF4FED8|nr:MULTISPECIES: ATP-binding protein [unclassified Demequina]MCB2412265.1 HAMP domain-containing protein [Demequina sp. TTPB684]UPU87097.1 ATP-binding protein [Demequina sp. TMPB413]